jgi:NAD+ diphosphatase
MSKLSWRAGSGSEIPMDFPSSTAFAIVGETGAFVPQIVPPPAPRGAAVWLLYQGERLVGRTTGEGSLPLVVANPEAHGLHPLRTQYLGYWETAHSPLHCFSGDLAEDAVLPADFVALDLRTLFGVWDDRWIGVAGRAKLLAHWDRDHQFCGRCRGPLEAVPGERARRCPGCGLSCYPRISPAIIIAITRHTGSGEQILLARNHRFPPGRYSVLAGFVEAGETLEECAAREVREEVGIEIADMRYFGSQSWPFPNSLMIGLTAEYAGGEITLEESEIADAQWFAPDAMPQLPPRISIARRLIEAYLARQAPLTAR